MPKHIKISSQGERMDRYYNANAVLAIFSKTYMDLKKNLPIRPSEMGVLNIITKTEGPHTPVKIAELLGVSKPMITTHMTSLESKGYITKKPCSQDKRVYYVSPTDKALQLVEFARKDMNQTLNCLIDGLGQDNFNTLIDLVEKANHIMKEALSKNK